MLYLEFSWCIPFDTLANAYSLVVLCLFNSNSILYLFCISYVYFIKLKYNCFICFMDYWYKLYVNWSVLYLNWFILVFILLMSSSYCSLFLCFLNFSAHTTATCNAYQSAGGGINKRLLHCGDVRKCNFN